MTTRHLLSATDLTRDEATAILDNADRFRQALLGREVKKLPTLRGRTIITMFYENSTRTRVSFEVAGKWMSADVINVSSSGSSVAKGESQAVAWAVERADGGRGFGFTGGHYHKNWGDDNFRKVVLNAILWVAKVEVPANGVNSTVTAADLLVNLDRKAGRPK